MEWNFSTRNSGTFCYNSSILIALCHLRSHVSFDHFLKCILRQYEIRWVGLGANRWAFPACNSDHCLQESESDCSEAQLQSKNFPLSFTHLHVHHNGLPLRESPIILCFSFKQLQKEFLLLRNFCNFLSCTNIPNFKT